MLRKLIQSVKTNIAEHKRNNSLPGKYKLYEYYSETEKELVHVEETKVTSEKLMWDVEFLEGGGFFSSSNLDIPLVAGIEATRWSKLRNFVTLLDPGDFRKNVEFQYAFEKGNLKLLKKDKAGKILIFAFFNRIS